MKLLDIYKCLCDETRLRILHLLDQGPLCVCHFQSILDAPQVAISKHLGYLRDHGLVQATRHGQWMIYQIQEPRRPELAHQLEALAQCVRAYPLFQQDLERAKKVRCECDWIAPTRKRARSRQGTPQLTRKAHVPT